MNAIPDEAGRKARAAAEAARAASRIMAASDGASRAAALHEAAAALRAAAASIQSANVADLAAAPGIVPAFRDRLTLTPARIEAMARGLEDVASLPDPVGRELGVWTRPNGLVIRRVAQPIGVIGMIFESRPNVTADAAALAIRSGNAIILRSGSEAARSAAAIHAAVAAGLRAAGLPEEAVQLAPTQDRAFVGAMLAASGLIDLIIPRGGKALVERVLAEARVPVLAHAEGLCHTYVHAAADPAMAEALVVNGKLRRTGICSATETLLIDASVAPGLLPRLLGALRAAGCAFRADDRARAIVPDLPAAIEVDFATEWLDAVLNIAVVDGPDAALAHIARFGSSHTEAIVTQDEAVARDFLRRADSSVVLWNASTQFNDGGEFGFGAEIGIATGRMHARGPVGMDQLCTYRYVVEGTGQIRP